MTTTEAEPVAHLMEWHYGKQTTRSDGKLDSRFVVWSTCRCGWKGPINSLWKMPAVQPVLDHQAHLFALDEAELART